MDSDRFDTLTRLIGSRTSRRAVVGLAATGLLSIAVPTAEAARCSKKKPCPVCKRCRRRRCKPDATQNDAPCGDDKVCQSGDCVPDSTGGTPCPTCSGDKVCNESTSGICTCPDNKPVQCEFNSNRCSEDPNTDSTRCGLNCVDCSTSFAPGYHCCSGQCVNGCGPNTDGSCLEEPCGPSCEPCTGGKVCCNLGPGTTGQCVDLHPVSGKCPTA